MVNMLLAGNAQSKVGIFLICPQSNSAKKIRSSAKTRRAAPATAPCGGLHRPAGGVRRILRRPQTEKRQSVKTTDLPCNIATPRHLAAEASAPRQPAICLFRRYRSANRAVLRRPGRAVRKDEQPKPDRTHRRDREGNPAAVLFYKQTSAYF